MSKSQKYSKELLVTSIIENLNNNIVLLQGPLGCGKSTLSKSIFNSKNYKSNKRYLCWDTLSDRITTRNKDFIIPTVMLVADEIHKYPDWSQLILEAWNTQQRPQILIAGSAQLDQCSQGKTLNSLPFKKYRIHPLSFSETNSVTHKDLHKLLN